MAKHLKRKHINFYSAFYRKPPLNPDELRKRVIFGIPVGLAAALLLATGIIYGAVLYSNYKLQGVNEYINDETVAQQYEIASELEKDQAAYRKELNFVKEVRTLLGAYPQFTTDQIEGVYACVNGGASVLSLAYNSDEGILMISAEAPDYKYAAETVAALRATNYFDDVAYQGYESGDNGVYRFNAYCLMKGGEAR